jgi:asparagine synthetase B (glutamine-hydrolysing)
MSGAIILLGAQFEAQRIAQAAANAARGPITAEWFGRDAALCYQGPHAQREFYASATQVCIAIGWPYVINATGLAQRLDARTLAEQFGRTELDARAICGQYLIALYCIQSARLRVLRDIHGSFPLHWAALPAGSVHASDVRQIAAATGRPLALSVSALQTYQQQLALPAATDLYQGVHLYAPGATFCASASRPQPATERAAPALSVLFQRFGEAARADLVPELVAMVRRAMTLCVEPGATALSVSGGMDSALLLLCANADTGRQQRLNLQTRGLQTLACTFPGKRCDESSAIAALIACAGKMDDTNTRQHATIEFHRPEFSAWQTQLFSATDYVPFPANQIGLQIARAAQRLHCSVLLDGNGGDELFDWSPLELAQTARTGRDYAELVRQLLSKQLSGQRRYMMLRHLLKRTLRGRLRQPLTPMAQLYPKVLSPSTGRAFYLAAEQIASTAGCALYSPMRDWALIERLAPWMPAGSFRSGRHRGLQSDAIYQLSSGSIRLRREKKVNFDEFATVVRSPSDVNSVDVSCFLPDLGDGKLAAFADLMPRFLAHKVLAEGVLLAP